MKSLTKIISALLLTLISATGVYAEPWDNMGNYGYHMMGYGGMGWMMIVYWFIILVALIMVIRWIYSLMGNTNTKSLSDRPLEILKERFARGEIDLKEFEEKKKIISGS